MTIEIIFKKTNGVCIAIALDENGAEIDRISALSKPNAKKLLESKLGIKNSTPSLENQKKAKKTKVRVRV
ncbi:hypothetical protein BZG78_10255 [Salinivibrio sp. MA351]|uniref:hypothetical protein n=1 Tax=Salinivibrio sp. MA351 TaxID=1909453 RepID=UPI0009895481|nr:hypothetical protein [Salinivibrio sp. MA351]OOE97998.1 hypothetical protein BZG78_10255 [Salinivibrio sp. MA351]